MSSESPLSTSVVGSYSVPEWYEPLHRCVERGEGIGVVVGPVGTGKTLLCLKLADQLKSSFRVVLLSSGRLGTRRSLFQAILYELDQPYRSGRKKHHFHSLLLLAGTKSFIGAFQTVDHVFVLTQGGPSGTSGPAASRAER